MPKVGGAYVCVGEAVKVYCNLFGGIFLVVSQDAIDSAQ